MLKLSILIILISVLFSQLSCTNRTVASQTGIISVSVVDNDPDETPIPDVEITITPGNIVKKTDVNGLCSFELDPPGEYYVDADVCCIGPGYIQYHELARVSANETTEIKLVGCLSCD